MIVLPDADHCWEAVACEVLATDLAMCHPSGRPWLVIPAAVDRLTASVGSVRVAVIGSTPVTAARLAELARWVHTLSDVDAIARALPGSFHLVASVGGRVRVQGSLSGLRRVFHTVLDGSPVAADHPEILARLTDASVSDDALAVRVTCGLLPPPLGEQSAWSGIRALPPDHYLVLDPDRDRQVHWWDPPEPHVRIEAGAELLTEALDAAVAHRRPRQGRLGADLSGGLDSSSLCLLAARHDPDLLTFRWAEAEAGNDDAWFAALAAAELPRAEHVVVPQQDLPSIYADPATTAADLEQPYPFARTAARVHGTARTLAEHGVGRHLAGHGGDELFGGSPGHLHGLLRRHPLAAIRQIRGYRALYRWPLSDTVATLARTDSVAQWWRDTAAELGGPVGGTPARRRVTMLEWAAIPVSTPKWVTAAALAATRDALRRTAATATALSTDRGQHQALSTVRTTAGGYRQLARMYAQHDITLDMPYLDDRVVEAALAVRTHERTTPWRYKPLLAEAMRGVLPPALLTRTTKGEFGEDVRVGVRRNRAALLDVFADSALAERGLVDGDVLRAQLLAPQQDNRVVMALEQLLGCEMWLRSAVRPRNRGRV